jgi:hypothetical protein
VQGLGIVIGRHGYRSFTSGNDRQTYRPRRELRKSLRATKASLSGLRLRYRDAMRISRKRHMGLKKFSRYGGQYIDRATMTSRSYRPVSLSLKLP